MADTIRIRSTLPLATRISEPHPNPEKPGDSPALRSVVLRPGVNELSGEDVDLWRAWSGDAGKGFVASDDDVKAGHTDGKFYEMREDEPEAEYGFQPALDRAADAMKSDDAASTAPVDRPLSGDDMRTPAPAAQAAPVLASATPLKVPATTDAGGLTPAGKTAAAADAKPAPVPAK